MIVVLVVLGLGLLFFIINTIRCYLVKSRTDQDEDEEYNVEYDERGGRMQPL
jgi:hypothetical protein